MNTNKIIKLSKIWYSIISLDHHKDRDCHWRIEIEYNYGEEPIHTVYHYGYVYKKIKKIFKNLGQAKQFLKHTIYKAIKQEYYWAKKILAAPDDWDICDLKWAQAVINLLNKSEFENILRKNKNNA